MFVFSFLTKFNQNKEAVGGQTKIVPRKNCKKLVLRSGLFFVSAAAQFSVKEGFAMTNLTAKELSAIKDQLGVEENLIKKYKMYAQNTQDMVLKQKCEDIACKHQNHFNTLMGHLS